jgi:hypothetical protein
MFLLFEVRLLTFLHSSTCNTLEDFVGCLFWALGITRRIRFPTVGFSVIVDFSICSVNIVYGSLFVFMKKNRRQNVFMEFCFLSKEIVAKIFLANKSIICFEGWCNIYLKLSIVSFVLLTFEI